MTCPFVKIVIVASLAAILGTSCQNRSTWPSILDYSACEPPCWQHITPGLTSHQQFLDSLQRIPHLVPGSLRDYGLPSRGFQDFIRARYQFPSEAETYLDAYLLNDKVAVLVFVGGWDLTLGQAISKLGEPTDIAVFRYGGDVFVQMVTPIKGIAFGYSSVGHPSWWHSRIEPDIRIDSIQYFALDAYQPMLDAELLSYSSVGASATLAKMRQWKGYGDLSQYEDR